MKVGISIPVGTRVGSHAGKLTIETDMALLPRVQADLLAEIQSEINLKPSFAFFGFLGPDGASPAKEIRIFSAWKDLELACPPDQHENIVTELKTEGPGQFHFVLRVSAVREKGFFKASIRLKTNCASEPEITIPVYAWLR